MNFSFQMLDIVLCLCIILPFVFTIFAIVCSRYKYHKLSAASLKNKHVVITGGSSGIGKSLACEAAKRGAHVTIIARNEQRLSLAKQEILQSCNCSTQRVFTLSLDICANYEDVEKSFIELEQDVGPVFMLINCAGVSVPAKLEDSSVQDIKKMFELNCIGSIFPTKAVVEGMKSRGYGHIVFVSSQAAFVGIFGFTTYSASKFAIRGFAEALSMEVRDYGISVTVSYPPDTDTPGFIEEEKNKPQETKLISQTSGLWKPRDVASSIMKDALAGYFTSVIGMDGFLLAVLCAGMSPFSSIFHLVMEVLLMGPFRIIAAIYQLYFQIIIKKCMVAKNKSKKAE